MLIIIGNSYNANKVSDFIIYIVWSNEKLFLDNWSA